MDFREQFNKQLRFLETSCMQYDAGNKDEAVRIATSLRVLFHDTKFSTSLLTHLIKSKNIILLSTGEDIPVTAEFWPNLTNLELSPMSEYALFKPKLDSALTKRFFGFDKWWGKETVYRLKVKKDNVNLTRRDLILAAVNKDGGAHVDKEHDAKYETLLEGAGWSMHLNKPDNTMAEVKFQYAHLSALRQIGYEVLNSSDILKLK